MTETKRCFSPDGAFGASHASGLDGIAAGIVQEQASPIAELTADMIFISGIGFALTPFGQRMQAVLMDYCYINTGEPSAVKIRELQAQIARACEEIGVDSASLAARKQQFSALVQARQNLAREQWHALSIGRR